MDNLSDFKELDLVPYSYIKMLKEDKSKHLTIIEYSTSQIAVVENNLLICNESVEKYYEVCNSILLDFRLRVSGSIPDQENSKNNGNNKEKLEILINPKIREIFLENFGFKNWTYDLNEKNITSIKENEDILSKISKGEGFNKKTLEALKLDKMYLKIVELASKIMLCFNGENPIAYNTRIDLFLLNFLKDFNNELKIINLSLKKYRKCYIGWFYRRILYSICHLYEKERFLRSAESKNYVLEAKDFGRIKLLWEEEYDRVVDSAKTKNRSYKLWEYLSLFMKKMKNEIFELIGVNKDMDTEIEIFLIENFLNFYEKGKKLCEEDVHNNCAFEYLNTILRCLFEMRINEFMDDDKFYDNFIEDHKIWIDGVVKHHENLNIENKDENKRWAGLTMVDYSKLESLKAHQYVAHHWKEYSSFCNMVMK